MSGGPLPPAAARLGDLFARLHRRELPVVVWACRLQRHPGLRRLMLVATRGGDGWALLVLLPIAYALDGSRALAGLGCGILSGLGVGVVVQGLKALVRRNRPSGEGVQPPIGAPDRWAFPSGHTAHSVSVLIMLSWVHPAAGLISLPLTCGVGFSRVFFGLHYPSDVVAGALIGAGLACGTLGAAEASGLTDAIIRMGPPA